MTQPGLIIVDDVLDGLARMDDNSVDAIVTDPPYDLLQASRKGSGRSNNPDSPAGRHGAKTGGFMGLAWDATGVAFRQETWEACLRVLKPGGHLIAFGGGRTHHRMWCAIEDAGFEVRELVCYLFGTGFPKSLDVSKAIDKAAGAEREVVGKGINYDAKQRHSATHAPDGGATYLSAPEGPLITAPATDAAKQWEGFGTALKPAVEPILLARKPLSEPTVAANVLKWGTGALAIDATRLGLRDRTEYGLSKSTRSKSSVYADPSQSADFDSSKGRWPANVLFECICDDPRPLPDKRKRKNEPTQSTLLGGADPTPAKPETSQGVVHQSDCPAGMLDAQAGGRSISRQPASKSHSSGNLGWTPKAPVGDVEHDYGGPSRFFYCSKASRAERERGLEDFEPISGAEAVNRKPDTAGLKSPRAGAGRSAGTGLTKRDIIGAWVNEVLEAVRQEDMAGFLRQVTEGFGSADACDWSTVSSGKRRTERSPKGSTSTTGTETGLTIDSETSDSLTIPHISAFIRAAFSELESGLSPADFAACLNRLIERTGTSAKKAGRSTDAAVLAISEKLSTLSAEGGLPVGVGVRNAHPT